MIINKINTTGPTFGKKNLFKKNIEQPKVENKEVNKKLDIIA